LVSVIARSTYSWACSQPWRPQPCAAFCIFDRFGRRIAHPVRVEVVGVAIANWLIRLTRQSSGRWQRCGAARKQDRQSADDWETRTHHESPSVVVLRLRSARHVDLPAENGVASARVTIMHDTASLASGSYRPRGTARTCVSVWCLSVGYEHEEIGASECGTGVGPPRVSVTLT
jgi:hypothetical protein